MYHGMHVEVRRQFEGVNSLLLLCRPRVQTQAPRLVHTDHLTGPKNQIPNKIVLFLLGLFATGLHGMIFWHSNSEQ